jgi:putative hemolysin
MRACQVAEACCMKIGGEKERHQTERGGKLGGSRLTSGRGACFRHLNAGSGENTVRV